MLLPHKWEISVSAGSYYPSLTHGSFGDDISLEYENDYMGMKFFAYSYHIDELDDVVHIGRRLYSLQLLINGSLRADWQVNDFTPIKFIEFVGLGLGVGGFNSIESDYIEEFPFSKNQEIDSFVNDLNNYKINFHSHLLYLSKKDDAIRIILFLLGVISTNSSNEKILTWGTLYKIYDNVKFYSKKINCKIEDFVEISQIDEFKAAVNNMSILGIYARHGATNKPAPKKVITNINRAILLITKMAGSFLKTYVTHKYP